MNIPDFPQSREMTLQDKPIFDNIFHAYPPEISTYTFTNLFAWRNAYNTRISTVGEHILVHHHFEDRVACLLPLGQGDVVPAMRETFECAGGKSLRFERLPLDVAAKFEGTPGLAVKRDRDNFDYVYSAQDLINLAGRKYDGKRNFISRIRGKQEYEYLKIDQEIALECERFADQWCETRECETSDGLRKELCAIHEMLVNYDALGIVGGAIRMSGEIVAFSLGEALNPETLVIHVEKADTSIEGLYQLINNEFCIHEAQGFQYVNREQDLGIPGLRKAKKSYHPIKMVETYVVKRTG